MCADISVCSCCCAGHTAILLEAPAPANLVVVGASVTHYVDVGDVTWYHIKVFANGGQNWATKARYSAFEALQSTFEFSNIQV